MQNWRKPPEVGKICATIAGKVSNLFKRLGLPIEPGRQPFREINSKFKALRGFGPFPNRNAALPGSKRNRQLVDNFP